MKRLTSVAALVVALGLLLAPLGSARLHASREPVTIQLLDISDWHAQLDPQNGIGGAAALSTYFKQDRAANPNTITLTAGDAYGASPPLSGFFNDEPAVKALNLMGLQADTFGNHNFDKGLPFLQNLIDLADFKYVSANLTNLDDNLSGVDPWTIITVGGVKVGIVGITNPEAPTLVFPGSLGTMQVTDPVPAANKARARAQAAGAKVTVAITHLGVLSRDASGAPVGPLVDFANGVGGFDVIFGDHTDFQYSGVINDQLVVENLSHGASYSRTNLTVDPRNGRVASATNDFVTPIASAVTPDQAVVTMLAPYRRQLAAAFDQPAGVATGLFARGGTPAVERIGEVAVGDLTTDALRTRYGTQIAFTNGGGLRSTLPASGYLPQNHLLRRATAGYAPGPPYDLVVGDVYTLLPFGNIAVTRTLTGIQLWSALEYSVSRMPLAFGGFLQISGFKFTYDSSRPSGSRVISVTLDNGTPILPDSTLYTAATNNFTNAGGDGYTMLADGQGTTREVLADVVLDYIRTLGTISPTTSGRITNIAP
jgi:5'-nucleotidase